MEFEVLGTEQRWLLADFHMSLPSLMDLSAELTFALLEDGSREVGDLHLGPFFQSSEQVERAHVRSGLMKQAVRSGNRLKYRRNAPSAAKNHPKVIEASPPQATGFVDFAG